MTKWTHVVPFDFDVVLPSGGMRIGGSGGALEIGGTVDGNLAVLRNPLTGKPYIPGSSLKGKLRSTLEKMLGKTLNGKPCGCGERTCAICSIFGPHLDRRDARRNSGPSRILVRDAPFTDSFDAKYEEITKERKTIIEEKTENFVNRESGKATNFFTGERVLAGAEFRARIVLHVYEGDPVDDYIDLLLKGLRVIEQADALGASGSRGYGEVRFRGLERPKPISLDDLGKRTNDEKQ